MFLPILTTSSSCLMLESQHAVALSGSGIILHVSLSRHVHPTSWHKIMSQLNTQMDADMDV